MLEALSQVIQNSMLVALGHIPERCTQPVLGQFIQRNQTNKLFWRTTDKIVVVFVVSLIVCQMHRWFHWVLELPFQPVYDTRVLCPFGRSVQTVPFWQTVYLLGQEQCSQWGYTLRNGIHEWCFTRSNNCWQFEKFAKIEKYLSVF